MVRTGVPDVDDPLRHLVAALSVECTPVHLVDVVDATANRVPLDDLDAHGDNCLEAGSRGAVRGCPGCHQNLWLDFRRSKGMSGRSAAKARLGSLEEVEKQERAIDASIVIIERLKR